MRFTTESRIENLTGIDLKNEEDYNKITSVKRDFDKFFSQDDGIIPSDYDFNQWKHGESGLWLFNKLIENKPELKEKIIENFDVKSPYSTIIKLAKMKIADGIELAEIAGSAYAQLTAFLGGTGAYWIGDNAGIISPIQKIPKAKEFEKEGIFRYDKDKLLEKKCFETNGERCHENNYNKVFGDKKYDLVMAVNHGNSCGDKNYIEIAEKILKENKNLYDNTYVKYQNTHIY
jgi:hypothetical protein